MTSKHRAINIPPRGAITVAVCDAIIPPAEKTVDLQEAEATD